MEQLFVERSIWIAAPPVRVWRAVTEPAELDHWYAPGCPWEIPALEAGAAVRFYNTPEEILTATIEVVDPPREFSLRWQPTPDQPDADVRTRFRLEPADGGTRVTILESGYETLPAAVRKTHAEQADAGYVFSLDALKGYLEGVPA